MTTRNGKAAWRMIQQHADDDDLDEILAMSDEQLDAEIRKHGGDPAAIGAAGEALAKELFERRTRLAWHEAMQKKLDTMRATAASMASRPMLPRAELLARIEAARNDPRFAAPVAAMFRNKTADASTDAELSALLVQIELLAKLGDDE